MRFQKLPTQLNTLNIFVPDLVQVSPSASDVQRLGRCVPALNHCPTQASTSTSQISSRRAVPVERIDTPNSYQGSRRQSKNMFCIKKKIQWCSLFLLQLNLISSPDTIDANTAAMLTSWGATIVVFKWKVASFPLFCLILINSSKS